MLAQAKSGEGETYTVAGMQLLRGSPKSICMVGFCMAFQDPDFGGLPTRVPLKKNAETKVYGGPMMQDRRHWHLAEAACGSNRRSLPSRPHNMLELTLQKEFKNR